MSSSETRLKDSLTAEDEAFLQKSEEGDRLLSQLGSAFAGPMKFWTGFAFVLSFAFFGIAVWAGFQIYGAAEPRMMVFWLGIFLFAMIAVGLIKIWFWMRMSHLALLSELKRIERRLLRAS